MTEMMNQGTDLEAINKAAQRHREQEQREAQQVPQPRADHKRVSLVCLMAIATLAGIVGLCYMGAMAYWLGTVMACAVTLRLGLEIGREEVMK